MIALLKMLSVTCSVCSVKELLRVSRRGQESFTVVERLLRPESTKINYPVHSTRISKAWGNSRTEGEVGNGVVRNRESEEMKWKSSRHQEEEVFQTVCGDSRLMGVCEQNRSKDSTCQIGGCTRGFHCPSS